MSSRQTRSSRRSLRLARIVVPVLLLAWPAGAGAHGARAEHDPAALGRASHLPNGLLEVKLPSGKKLTTHGADGPTSSDALEDLGRRPPLCTSDNHQRILYGRPALSPDRRAASVAHIESVIWGMNALLDRAAVESGGRHADFRVACDASGGLQIDSFVNPGSSSFGDVVAAARAAGATDPGVDYTIFYDDTTPQTCGVATLTDDDRLAADNANNRGGGYSITYADCWEPATVMHEVGHTQGAIQRSAPNATAFGHCRDELDVMCYADGSEGAAGMLLRCKASVQWDCGYDDYFDVAPEPGEYLETHWNLGSELNKFIQLGEAAVPVVALAEELVSAGSQGASQPGGAQEAAPAVAAPVVRILARARALASGRISVRLSCPAARGGPCRGTVRVTRGRSRSAARTFSVRAGGTRAISLRLPGRRAATARLTRLRVVARDSGAARTTARSVRVGR